jgi:DNA-binding MarR family transcriptional regulator
MTQREKAQRERTKRATGASGDVEKRVLLELFRAGDRCRRFIAALLAPWGLTPQQFNVLRILRGAGPEGLPTLVVGERMLERTPGVTRMIDRLEGRGLVIRRRCTEDRRKVFCAIAPAGLELLDRLDDPVAAGDRRCVDELSAAEAETLVGLLARCGPRAPD